jgi:PIN domain nuclease of toxin-antitoxin system
MKKYVLDACALIALFQKEQGSDIIENLLVEAGDGDCSVSIRPDAGAAFLASH